MPNAKVLSEKQAIVAELTAKLQSAAAGVLVDYRGITVAEDTALRAELRKNNVGLEGLDEVLNGTTSLATSAGDPIAPMRVINKYAKQLGDGKFTIKGGFMDGKVMPLNEVMALAEIPPIPVLRAQVLGTMLAPISGLACVLKQIAEKQGAPAEEAAAEAPAAE